MRAPLVNANPARTPEVRIRVLRTCVRDAQGWSRSRTNRSPPQAEANDLPTVRVPGARVRSPGRAAFARRPHRRHGVDAGTDLRGSRASSSKTALLVGLATALGAGVSMGISEALSDTGEETNRGRPRCGARSRARPRHSAASFTPCRSSSATSTEHSSRGDPRGHRAPPDRLGPTPVPTRVVTVLADRRDARRRNRAGDRRRDRQRLRRFRAAALTPGDARRGGVHGAREASGCSSRSCRGTVRRWRAAARRG
jgi:hypothetical protein